MSPSPAGPLPSRYHQVYWRTRRGGWSIPRGHAAQEFEAVFEGVLRWLDDDADASFRRVELQLSEHEIRRRASRLGFSSALVEVERVPAEAGAPAQLRSGQLQRREADAMLLLTTVARPEPLPPSHDGIPDRRRRLSGYDARWCANLLPVEDGARVLDPFAGLGVLAAAAEGRGLHVVALEQDRAVGEVCRRGGLLTVRADARAPPHRASAFDAVLTEPPYREHERDVVLASLPRLCAVLRPRGVLGLLLANSLYRDICHSPMAAQLTLERDTELVRHGWACRYVVLRKRG